MDKKSKILLLIFFLLIVGSVAFTYYRIMVKRDYIITAQTDCDPYTENCFIWECDPESSVEGEACTGDPEVDIWYYKNAKRSASRIPACNPEEDETCQPWICDEGEKDCEEILCSEETVPEGENCNDPEEYALDNPLEEEEAECDSETAEECGEEAVEECNPELDEECAATEGEGEKCDPEVDEECLTAEETEVTTGEALEE
jgi:hypothetical protein